MRQSDRVRTLSQRPAAPDPTPLPTVPGLTLCRPLSPGSPGPPWRAKDLKSGYDVVVRELPDACSTGLLDQLPDHPHLLAPALRLDAAGRSVLVTRFAPHRGLDQLLARRSGVTPGEVSTIALAVGRALAVLHAAGLVHGGVRPSAVLLGVEGRPFLDAAGMVTAPDSYRGQPADDVVSLARMLSDAVEAPVPPAMAEALAAAASSDPTLQPAASELVRRLVAAAPPEPVRLVAHVSPVRPRPARRRVRLAPSAQVRGRLLVGVGASAGLALAVAAGTAWAQLSDRTTETPRRADAAGPPPLSPQPVRSAAIPAASPTVPVPVADWAAVLSELDGRRAEAFSSGDTDALTDVDAPGSLALGSDVAALRALAAAGVNASGFRQVLRAVAPLSVSAWRAVLRVVDERPAYLLVSAADGSTVVSRAARGRATWQVELVRGPAGWQIRSVKPG
jgi:eukaryotic-like serine/threonine-protein kinase